MAKYTKKEQVVIRTDDLPHNTEAEKAVLGAMLIYPEAVVNALGSLDIEEFFEGNTANRAVFKVIRSLQDKYIPIDVQTITDELINSMELDIVGGTDYLLELSQTAISVANLEFYIQIIKDQAVLRRLLMTFREIDHSYLTEEIVDINDFISEAEIAIRKVTERRRISTFIDTIELTKRARESIRIQSQRTKEDGLTGVNTGYTRLNSITHGLQNDNLIILAARPGVGKTALALNIAFNASRKDNIPVAIFSIEMAADMLTKRLVANRACVDLDSITTGFLSERQHISIEEALNEISQTSIFIDETPGIKLNDIIAKSRKLKSIYPNLGLIIVDHIGLIVTSKTKKYDSRQLEVSEISRSLKELARELKVPVIAVSQLSREVEKRVDKRPQLSDLRESGSIEQDADMVFLLFREDYYTNLGIKTTARQQTKGEGEQADKKENLDDYLPGDASPIEIIVAKNRNGKTGTVALHFFKSYGRFDNPTKEYEDAYAKISQSGPGEE